MIKRFKDFLLRTLLNGTDYIVGYDGVTGEEIRIKVSNMLQKGDAGASADIQFSANTENWHFPAMNNDVYVRFRVGLGEWSVSRFVGVDGENGIPGIAAYYSADAQSWHPTPLPDDQYIQFQLTDNTYTEPIKAFGIDGINGIDGLTATIDIGTTRVAEIGETPSVTNSGTTQDVVLDFVVPTATISIGSVTTVPEWNQASVTNSGTAEAAVLDFEIPQGVTGNGIPYYGEPFDFLVINRSGQTEWAKGIGYEYPYIDYVWYNPQFSDSYTEIWYYAKKYYVDLYELEYFGIDATTLLLDSIWSLYNGYYGYDCPPQEMTTVFKNDEGTPKYVLLDDPCNGNFELVGDELNSGVIEVAAYSTREISFLPIIDSCRNVTKIKAICDSPH